MASSKESEFLNKENELVDAVTKANIDTYKYPHIKDKWQREMVAIPFEDWVKVRIALARYKEGVQCSNLSTLQEAQ